MNLYPIKFKPILKERVWGGSQLADFKSLNTRGEKWGESWELSSVRGNLSVVANGFLKNNTIDELVEVYMGDLVGEKVYEKFGLEFPLLFKFIGTSDELSLQVHPSDELALERHNAYGKTEMWYVLDAATDARLYLGFKIDTTEEQLLQSLHDGSMLDLLNVEKPNSGNVYSIPAGCIHAMGRNVLVAEIQQTSDITYRIYDWGRENNPETARELHIDLALDAISYMHYSARNEYVEQKNSEVNLEENAYFKTALVDFDKPLTFDYNELDSFVVYMCVDGACRILTDGGEESMVKGETVLIPASLINVELIPQKSCKLLETYIP